MQLLLLFLFAFGKGSRSAKRENREKQPTPAPTDSSLIITSRHITHHPLSSLTRLGYVSDNVRKSRRERGAAALPCTLWLFTAPLRYARVRSGPAPAPGPGTGSDLIQDRVAFDYLARPSAHTACQLAAPAMYLRVNALTHRPAASGAPPPTGLPPSTML